jgi:hypothetical protein
MRKATLIRVAVLAASLGSVLIGAGRIDGWLWP